MNKVHVQAKSGESHDSDTSWRVGGCKLRFFLRQDPAPDLLTPSDRLKKVAMQWTKFRIFLAALLVITGSINTLSTKWADRMDSVGRDGTKRKFNHPFLQASVMFLGEMACLATFKVLKWGHSLQSAKKRDLQQPTTIEGNLNQDLQQPTTIEGNLNFKAYVLLFPALCDMIATSTMYIGLTLTYASSFQMLRGSVIVFVALLSMVYLEKKLKCVEWFGIFFIIAGLSVVGLSDFMSDASGVISNTNAIITGDLLIVGAQIITAFQMVYEEKFVTDLNIPPLLMVGYEGFWGFLILGSLLVPFYYIPAYPPFSDNPRNVIEDAVDGLQQLRNNALLCLALIGTFISIAFFNFAGVSVTKEMSATTRMVFDSVRTIIIWAVCLWLEWQKFNYLQVIGFLLLLIGMCLYNHLIIEPTFSRLIKIMNRQAVPTEIYDRMEAEEEGKLDDQQADAATSNEN